MSKIISKTAAIVLLLMTMTFSDCAAEDYQFVDAEGTTGYYVDVDSVKRESRAIVFAKLAVVKAGQNRMYRYDVRFNHIEHSYQIVSSQVIEYDTKNVLESHNEQRDFRAYSPKSEMSEVLNFILNGGD